MILNTRKNIIVVLSLALVVCAYGGPTGKDVQALSDQVQKVMTDFLNESLTNRLTLHHTGIGAAYRNDDLCTQAKNTQSLFASLYRNQERLVTQIEEYEGDDWDGLYGETGLWRKAVADLQNTVWYETQVQLWEAIACDNYKSKATLGKIIEICNSGEEPFTHYRSMPLAVQAYAAMEKYEPGAKQKAIEILNQLSVRSDISAVTMVRSEILRAELIENHPAMNIKEAYALLAKHGLGDNFELNMRFGLCLLKRGNSSILEKTLNKWPGGEGVAGEVILSSLSKEYGDNTLSNETISKRTHLEITLASSTAKSKNYWDYEKVLMLIAGCEKFQRPGILFNIAHTQQKFSPEDAVENYLRAAEIRKKSNPENLESSAADIALHGALLACEISKRSEGGKVFAKNMLAKYYLLTGEKADRQILYFYAILLKDLGEADASEKVLREVSKGDSEFAQRATLEILLGKSEEAAGDIVKRNELVKELTNFIYSANHADKNIRNLRQQAIALCTSLLIKNGDRNSAKKVITMLDGYSDLDNGRFVEVKTAALAQLGEFAEAVELLSDNIGPNNCIALERPISILSETLRQIEHLKESTVGFEKFIINCCKLAEHCLACPESGVKDEASLLLAELLVLSGNAETENLQKADQLLKSLDVEKYRYNIDYMRTMARLLTTRGDFRNALQHWKAIIAYTDPLKDRSKQANIHWWQGQYYSILCFSRLKATTFTQTDHAIDVLLNSGHKAPPFWSEKLIELKNSLRQQKLD